MIVVGRSYCYTQDDLYDHFRRLETNDLNLDLTGTTHLDHESKVLMAATTLTLLTPHIRPNTLYF